MRRSVLLRQLYHASLLLGFDPRQLIGLKYFHNFVKDLVRFRKLGGHVDAWYPILVDKHGQAGAARGHYFHGDLLVAQKIFRADPPRHVDVGSRIDGFVAHVAAFRSIEVMDVRPLDAPIRNIKFVQRDILALADGDCEYSESVSCLHALEHFGLGRYGDTIDPRGHEKGFKNLLRLTKTGGTLYLSVPIGRPAVEFNAHRVLDPVEVIRWCDRQAFVRDFSFVDDGGALHGGVPVEKIAAACGNLRFGCGIYEIQKISR